MGDPAWMTCKYFMLCSCCSIFFFSKHFNIFQNASTFFKALQNFQSAFIIFQSALFNFSKCKQALIFYSGYNPLLIFYSSKYETVSNFCFITISWSSFFSKHFNIFEALQHFQSASTFSKRFKILKALWLFFKVLYPFFLNASKRFFLFWMQAIAYFLFF